MWPLPARLQFALQGLNLAMIIFSALMIWKTLMVVTHSESPVVVVLRCVLDARPPRVRCRWLGCLRRCSRTRVCVTIRSGSMKPAFQRGDILFLNNQQDDPIRVGEIVVFKVRGRDIPIVHRVLNVHER